MQDNGAVITFGSPENGQLGHGSNKQYIGTGNKLIHEPSPTPKAVKTLADHKIVKVECGLSHCIAMTDAGRVWAWGFGGFGRLGFGNADDSFVPMEIPQFSGNQTALEIKCGPACSIAWSSHLNFMLWGKFKLSGDGSSGQPWTYPKPYSDLSGWKVRSFSAGNNHFIVAADQSTIVWGQSCAHAELGLGEGEPKSLSRADKVKSLEDMTPLR